MRRRAALPLFMPMAWAARGALAQSTAGSRVQLQGVMGSRAALLLIDGELRTVQVGASVQGVKLLALDDGRATVEVAGRTTELRLGAAPGHVGSREGGRQVTLSMSSGGHFMSAGAINGRATQFMVDTGATVVALSQSEADKLGIQYRTGRPVFTQTANGVAEAHAVQLATVRLGNVEVRNVDAIVLPGSMPHVLLGNSFLSRFQMRRDNDLMTLDLRY